MKVQLRKIELLGVGLKEISALSTFEFETALKIAKNLNKLEVTIQTINKGRNKVFNKYAEDYESKDGIKERRIRNSSDIEKYNKEIEKYLDTETELKDIQMFKLKELKKSSISGNTLRQLFIIIEDL